MRKVSIPFAHYYGSILPLSIPVESLLIGNLIGCYGNMQFSDPSDGPDAIYGDVFLKSSFVVFKFPDGGQPQIGFATKSGSSPGGTPSSSSGGDAPGSSLSSAPSGNPSSDGSDAGNGSGGNDETDGKAGEDDTSGNSG